MSATSVVADVADAEAADLAERAGAPIYADPAFHACLATMTGGRVVRVGDRARDRRLRGAITWLESADRGHGIVVNALPWFGSHGGPVIDPALDRGERVAVAGRLAGAVRAAIDRPGVLAGTLILGTADRGERRRAIEAAFEPVAIDERITQATRLPRAGLVDGDEAARSALLMHVYGQKTRNLVRKGLREGFTIDVRDDESAWSELHRLHEAGMRAIGAPAKPREHLEALRGLPADRRDLWVASERGRIIAAVLLLRRGGTVEYVVPAVRADDRSRQPISAIVLEAMVDAVRRDERVWNWGGTPRANPGLHRFKAGFGAEDLGYAYLCRPGPGGEATLRRIVREGGRAALLEAAPWFYAWPFDRLEVDA